MIIRVSVNDNDFIAPLEDFFKKFRFSNFYEYQNYISSDIQFKEVSIEMHELLQKVIYKAEELTDAEKNKFIEYVRLSIIAYVNKLQPDDVVAYFRKNLTISVVEAFKETWENDEALYYFINADKYIVQ